MSLYDAKTANDFYKIIKANYRHYDMKIESLPTVLPSVQRHLVAEMPSTQFLDYSFATDYIHQCKYYYRITCYNCAFHIVSKSRPDLRNIKVAINDVMLIKQLYNIAKPLNFYLLMNPFKRYFAKRGEVMQAKHINGGFTNPYSNYIYIIRKQEYAKVMLHELMHHCRTINKESWHPNLIEVLKRHHNIHSKCKFYPNEAVIETLACMIYACLMALHRHLSFKEVLKKEKEHSCALANTIIRMQNNKPWYEETNTYSYVVLKYIFFCNFDKCLSKIVDDNLLTKLLLSCKVPYSRKQCKTLHLVYHR